MAGGKFQMVVKPLDYFKDLIFPRFCITCGKEGEWWCERCLSKSGCNPQCSHPENYGRNENHLDGILAFFNYAEDQPIALLLKQFKYRQAFEIGDVWKKIITAQAVSIAMYSDFTLLPVPLHPRRERERGFNQAEVLARIVSELPGRTGPIAGNLRRLRHTPRQAELPRAERLKNLTGAFAWQGMPVPAQVLLVDDVYTTGATMNECAKILKQVGAKVVFGLVLAKGGR